MPKPDTLIRAYDPAGSDRAGIAKVCCDSAFLGKPIDDIFSDREWFANTVITPYLTLEPRHTWVAETNGEVVGYLTGSTQEIFGYLRTYIVAARMLFELMPNYYIGKYDSHPRSRRFAEFVIAEGLFQVPKHPENAAHFHFNVLAHHRHRGIGTLLLQRFEHALKELGIDHYYAEVMSAESWRPPEYYTNLGYHIFDSVPTTVFEPEIEDLHVLCIHRHFTQTT